ncbi:MAG: MATE family efflux transporter [Sphaerochaeta sp.]|jgi:putative MATE family efflux protein|uniref:MATE family efflux transporter n=1 Tax=Sphaerochaeta sp. TaxID=1972642 RepID=UPI002FCBCBF5
MRSKQIINLLDTSLPPRRIIWALAWPTILEQILQVTVTYVDSAMVGSLGAVATAAISVPTSTIWLVNGWMNAFAIGFSVLMARNLGSGKQDRAKLVTKQALVTSLYFGLVLTVGFVIISRYLPTWIGAEPQVDVLAQAYLHYIALGYLPNVVMILISTLLRCSGDSKTPLYLNGLNNILNIVLNLFFIFDGVSLGPWKLPGFGLGVQGAAIATSLSCTVTSILLLLILIRTDSAIRLDFSSPFQYETSIQKQAFRLALPVALERSTLSFGQIVLTKMVGTLGTTALAAHFLSNTAESITFLPPSGFATAATTLVAQSLGANDKALARKFADSCTIFGTVLMSLMGVVLFAGAPQLIGFFTKDPAVIALGATILRIEAFAEPGFGLSMLAFGVFRGAGDTHRPFLISLAGMWLLRLPLAYLLLRSTELGLLGIWIAMASDLTLRGLISLIQYRRFTWLDSWKETH